MKVTTQLIDAALLTHFTKENYSGETRRAALELSGAIQASSEVKASLRNLLDRRLGVEKTALVAFQMGACVGLKIGSGAEES